MGQPSLIQDCRELRDGLLSRDLQGVKIPRKKWDSIVARVMTASDAKVRVVTRTGEQQGFWQVHSGHGPGRGGWVLLLAPQLSLDLIEEAGVVSPVQTLTA